MSPYISPLSDPPRDVDPYSKYQAAYLAAYPHMLKRENRRLKRIIVALLIVGTLTWLLQWL